MRENGNDKKILKNAFDEDAEALSYPDGDEMWRRIADGIDKQTASKRRKTFLRVPAAGWAAIAAAAVILTAAGIGAKFILGDKATVAPPVSSAAFVAAPDCVTQVIQFHVSEVVNLDAVIEQTGAKAPEGGALGCDDLDAVQNTVPGEYWIHLYAQVGTDRSEKVEVAVIIY